MYFKTVALFPYEPSMKQLDFYCFAIKKTQTNTKTNNKAVIKNMQN